ncbi:MAG: UDP-N-acetylmuramoyl-L-alanyl-D-glutamate--2,6-diaminopimelate ligase [Pseudomonadota bacterium]
MRNTFWSLQNLLEGWVSLNSQYSSIPVHGLSIDSRSTRVGDLFFALKGLEQHGLQHSSQAIDNGAVAIAWESDEAIRLDGLPKTVPCIEVSDLHSKLGLISQRFYADVSRHMYVVGVTGTDGKTSVSQFIAQALKHLSIPCGVIGTLGYGVYPNLSEASHTTPDAIKVHGLLHEYYSNDVKHAVIEASSHGLVQGRLNGVNFNTAVLTNLGRDHMDYHASIKEYAKAKKLLFQSEHLQHAIINVDDEFGKELAHEFSESINVIRYSISSDLDESDSFLSASNIEYKLGETYFDIFSSWGSASISTKLVGSFNVSNLLAVLGVLLANGVKFNRAISAVKSLNTVPGRMEFIRNSKSDEQNAPVVVIDYAHTPQALENVLKVLRAQCDGKLYCVFGCGGDRDQGKRKLMAQAAERYANKVILTDDNPRFEDPATITREVETGFSTEYSYELIHDRRAAIKHAIEDAGPNDIVLVAGKGHEAMQIIKGKKLAFDDKRIAQEIMRNI